MSDRTSPLDQPTSVSIFLKFLRSTGRRTTHVHWGQSPTREPEVGVLLALPPMHCAAPDLASLGFSFHKSRKDPRSCTLGAGPLLARGCSPFLLGRVLGEGDRERSGTGRGSPLCLCPVLFAPAAQGPALHTLAGDWENHHAEPGETCTKQASRNGDDPKGSTSQTTRLTLEAAWCPPSCPPAPARWTAPARDPHFHFLVCHGEGPQPLLLSWTIPELGVGLDQPDQGPGRASLPSRPGLACVLRRPRGRCAPLMVRSLAWGARVPLPSPAPPGSQPMHTGTRPPLPPPCWGSLLTTSQNDIFK
ncbi:uncharacterized protein LOC123644553 isoform X4 [Lemur catta]|uniref:uncharacterized protein LOC123644553 isoform X4 n=1 Tax=Lemur catta TaxID=9447 RepID=UPI001E26A324|nr:uncharacterized protein LOC123644553 isoform X4 [Lemur catta]XP_045416679.1 uncharacterized protein LOC123644553 isoform X4 [Lemur catta]XP_045416689.1 uncharacterized protein LOC123644553 isoform X4 [Lemur catta]XP_045416698.1 uncharacterized protein LOC123644553 isoform X4 [Lemur catta]